MKILCVPLRTRCGPNLEGHTVSTDGFEDRASASKGDRSITCSRREVGDSAGMIAV
jgi:hypothetical protein